MIATHCRHGYIQDDCQTCLAEEDELGPHYHVVEFINGCLNDYDSGPIESLQDAREYLRDMRRNHDTSVSLHEEEYQPAGEDRYESGIYILKIEACSEDCDPDADY